MAQPTQCHPRSLADWAKGRVGSHVNWAALELQGECLSIDSANRGIFLKKNGKSPFKLDLTIHLFTVLCLSNVWETLTEAWSTQVAD